MRDVEIIGLLKTYVAIVTEPNLLIKNKQSKSSLITIIHRVDILTLCFSTNTIYDNTNEKQNSRHIVYPQSHKHKSSSR